MNKVVILLCNGIIKVRQILGSLKTYLKHGEMTYSLKLVRVRKILRIVRVRLLISVITKLSMQKIHKVKQKCLVINQYLVQTI